MITQARLKELLKYDPVTGIFRARVTRSTRIVGQIVGCKAKRKNIEYLRINIDYKYYYAHRLAWLYVNGSMPRLIDHINRNGLDNRIDNLRLADHTQNHINCKIYINNKTGFKGVCLDRRGKYRATIKNNKKQIHIGTFDTPEEAYAAYITHARKLYGDFVRTD